MILDLFFILDILGVIYYLGELAFGLYLILSLAEMITMKVIYIFKFSKIAAMDEYFITKMLIFFNIIIIGFHIIPRIVTNEYMTTPILVNHRNQDFLDYLNERTSEQESTVR